MTMNGNGNGHGSHPGPKLHLPPERTMRIALVGSSGGHLRQLWQLKDWWDSNDRFWVTFATPDAKSLLAAEDVHWAHHPTTRNVPNLLRNTVLAWRLLRSKRPDVVISTGAGVAFPFFVLGKLLGVKTVYLEVYDRIDLPTMTGRLCYPFTDLFLVQWTQQRRFYPRARLVGTVL